MVGGGIEFGLHLPVPARHFAPGLRICSCRWIGLGVGMLAPPPASRNRPSWLLRHHGRLWRMAGFGRFLGDDLSWMAVARARHRAGPIGLCLGGAVASKEGVSDAKAGRLHHRLQHHGDMVDGPRR